MRLIHRLAQSSSLDWISLIGDELELEKQVVRKSDELSLAQKKNDNQAIRALERELTELQTRLPEYSVQRNYGGRVTSMYGDVPTIVQELDREYREQGFVELAVFKISSLESLNDFKGKRLFLEIDHAIHSKSLFVVSEKLGEVFGRVINSYDGYGVTEVEFVNSIITFLSMNKLSDALDMPEGAIAEVEFADFLDQSKACFGVRLHRLQSP